MLKNIFKNIVFMGRHGLMKNTLGFGKNLVILDSFSAKSELALLRPPGIFVPIQTLSTSQQ